MGLRLVIDVDGATCINCGQAAPLKVVAVHVPSGDTTTKAPDGWHRFIYDPHGSEPSHTLPGLERFLYICGPCGQSTRLMRPARARIVQRDPIA